MNHDLAPAMPGFQSLISLGYNDSAIGPKWQSGLYEKEYCPACLAPLGARTSEPLVVSKLPRSDLANFEQIMGRHLLVSDRLLALFSKSERSCFAPKAVSVAKKTPRQRTFFEITGMPSASHVAVAGGTLWHLASWRCGKCDYLALSGFHPRLPQDHKYSSFISETDLPPKGDEAFLLERSGSLFITMSEARWLSLRTAAASMSLWPHRVFVLPENEVLREAKVRIEKRANGSLRPKSQ